MSSYFDSAASTWDSPDKIARSRRIADAIVDAIPLDPGWSALDYGCGTGQLAWQLGPHVRHVTLADVSAGMLQVARGNAAYDRRRYTVLHHDLTEAPLPHAVDLAASALALHHIRDTDAVLANLRASLRPRGWVALADLDTDEHGDFHDHEFDGHHGFDRAALAAALTALGFTNVRTRTATWITKPRHGVDTPFPVFLVTGRLGA